MSQSGFFSRWSQRKQEQQHSPQDEALQDAEQPLPEEAQTADASPVTLKAAADTPLTGTEDSTQATDTVLTDDQMPDLDSIDGNSNVSAFFSEGVSKTLRKQALKAMFLKPEFNIRDGMDDYDLDYTDAPELAANVTSELRQWFKNKDPLNPDTAPAESPAEVASAAAADVDGSAENPEETPQNATPEPQETQDADQAALSATEPDQKATDLASGKTTTADSDSTDRTG